MPTGPTPGSRPDPGRKLREVRGRTSAELGAAFSGAPHEGRGGGGGTRSCCPLSTVSEYGVV